LRFIVVGTLLLPLISSILDPMLRADPVGASHHLLRDANVDACDLSAVNTGHWGRPNPANLLRYDWAGRAGQPLAVCCRRAADGAVLFRVWWIGSDVLSRP